MKRTTWLLAALALMLGSVGQAKADFFQVDLSSVANDSMVNYYGAAAPTGNTTLGGIPFDFKTNSSGYDWWGGVQTSLTMNVNLYGVTNIYSLINTSYGQPGPNAYTWIVFTGSEGATYTKYLVGDVDVRDWFNDGNTNTINGTTTTNVLSTPWWGSYSRLDMQDITLPAAFATQTLTSIQVVDDGAIGFSSTHLAGVTVEYNPAVPAPSSFTLCGTALFTVMGYFGLRRRKLAMV